MRNSIYYYALFYFLCAFAVPVVFSGCKGKAEAVKYPDNVKKQFERVDRLIHQNRFVEARQQIETIKSENPRDWKIRRAIMRLWFINGQLRNSVAEGLAIVENRVILNKPEPMTDSQVINICIETSAVLDALDQMDDALELLEVVLALDSSNSEAANGIAWYLTLKEENLQRALMLAERAVKKEPANASFVDTLGWVHFKMGNPQKAIGYLEKSVRLMPNHAELRAHLAECYLSLKNSPRALVEIDKACLLDTTDEEYKSLRKRIKDNYRGG